MTETQFLAPVVAGGGEEELDRSLRPRTLDDFVGQERIKEQLAIALEAATARGEALDHVLLVGPPGLGKTSLAFIVIREELGVGIRTIAGPGARAQGRHGRDPHRARGARRPLRRRDPPARTAPSRRSSTRRSRTSGSTSSSARARPRGRSRSTCRRSRSSARPRAPGLLTTPLRDRFGMTFRLGYYEPTELGDDRAALRADPRRRDRRRRGRRDRAALARHAAGREPHPPPRPRRRRGAPRGRDHAARSPARRSSCSRSTSEGLERIDRELLAARSSRKFERRAGRPLDARRRARRGAGHDRGRLRALPAPARLHPADAARPDRHRRSAATTSGGRPPTERLLSPDLWVPGAPRLRSRISSAVSTSTSSASRRSTRAARRPCRDRAPRRLRPPPVVDPRRAGLRLRDALPVARGRRPEEMIVPVGAIARITLGPPEQHPPFGFGPPAEKA